jgi:hypothetical protein
MITGLGGIAGIYHSHSGTIEWKITNLHGDFVATISGSAVIPNRPEIAFIAAHRDG